MKGGPRVRSGRPPESIIGADWTLLPADGRPGKAPRFPLLEPTTREAELWRRLWKLPQAVMWERQHEELTVALYVRRLVEAEQPGAPVSLSALVKQMGDGLGLTAPGLRANRWRIATPDDERRPRSTPAGRSTRDRLQVVADDTDKGA